MPKRFVKTPLALAIVAAAATLASGSTPKFWHVSTQADFLQGEVENLSIDGDGRLVLGPATETIHESSSPVLWAMAAAPDGGVWVGSGNEGKLFKIDKAGRASTVFDAIELEVHAVAAAPDGGVYAATSPDGKIYRVRPDGTSAVLFDPEDRYIWSLVVGADGTLYAGTGDRGRIYRIAADGEGRQFYDTKATHVTSLALDPEGQLLAGTEAPGRLFRIDATGKGFVLLDSRFSEIHAIRVDPAGVIYATAVKGRATGDDRASERPEIPTPGPTPSVSAEITAVSIADLQVGVQASAGSGRRDERDLKGAVYRIRPEGLWDIVWESAEDTPYDLVLEPGGAFIVGTGGKGKLYRVQPDQAAITLITRAAAQQVTAFLDRPDGGLYLATANPGRILRLSANRAERGSYESSVKDAQTMATWGTLRWRATSPTGTDVQLFTRSGNTARPDETWSPWSPAYRDPQGVQVVSPRARYLQWRAVLIGRGTTPVLTSVTAAYLERNLRPRVSGITVHPPGTAFQRPFSAGDIELAGFDQPLLDGRPPGVGGRGTQAGSPQLGRRVYQKGLQTFMWKADDENDDELLFDVLYRLEGHTQWQPLKRGLTDPILVWDTTSVPDGTYVIKVVASDSASNSPGTSLAGELESSAFDIDNTPPAIQVTSVRREADRIVASFTVRDEHSPVQRVEYSLDANRWRVIYPKDGIPDSRTELFEVRLDGDGPAPRSIIIRATDTMNNSATAVAEAKPGTGG